VATYFIGDIQACFDEFILLLQQVNFNHQRDHLYLVGDLIGRGPQALETLEYLIAHQNSIHPVLGNHDLHFLAISYGVKAAKKNDNFDCLLQSPHLAKYCDYLRNLPLIIHLPEHKIIVSHAGISPQWDIKNAIDNAQLVEQYLIGEQAKTLLTAMYNNSINDWQQCSTPLNKAIFTINSLTRMRYCDNDGHLDFYEKCSPSSNKDATLSPWFLQRASLNEDYRFIFGHWASLMGMTNNNQFIALDTGCLWQHWMTAWKLESNSYFRQNSLQ